VEHRVRSVAPEPKDNDHESFHDKPSCVELNFLLGCGSKYLESKIKAFFHDLLQKIETFDTIFSGIHPMLYELFMVWMVGSIAVIAVSMVLGGLLCVWCAYKSSKRTRSASNHARQLSHP
jgi:hypothetical protein